MINVGQTTFVGDAWENGREVFVHGWIYWIGEGIYRYLGARVDRSNILKLCDERRMISERRQRIEIEINRYTANFTHTVPVAGISSSAAQMSRKPSPMRAPIETDKKAPDSKQNALTK